MKRTLLLAMSLAAAAVQAQTFTSAVGPYSVPDATPSGTNVDINVAPLGTIVSVNSVTVFGLSHSWAGDLTATLTHVPSGTTVDLFDNIGVDNVNTFGLPWAVSGVNWQMVASGGATFSDSGPNGSGTYNTHTNAAWGSSSADGALGDFAGVSLNGVWRLNMADNLTGFGDGRFTHWEMNVTANPVPEPFTLALGGAALALAARRRLRRAA